ncbi:MAG: EamA family transporter [Bacteroidota bacterium]|nr:MAG: EamA family transporter [Bacteroidota bacterium]
MHFTSGKTNQARKADMQAGSKVMRWVYLLVLASMWGSSFILMKRGLNSFSANQVAAIRMFISCMVMLPFIASHLKDIPKKLWLFVMATGLLGNGIPAYLFTHAETGISGSMAGMLNSLTSMFTLVVGSIFFATQFSKRHLLGVIIGFAGAASLIWLNADDAQSAEPWKGVYVLIATVCYAFSVNILRNKLASINAVTLTGAALLFAGIPSGIYLFSTDFVSRFDTEPLAWNSFFYIALLAIMSTAISTVWFNHLIRISSAIYASSVTYLIPFVAVLWGLYDNETFNMLYLLALLVILTGIYLTNYQKRVGKF